MTTGEVFMWFGILIAISVTIFLTLWQIRRWVQGNQFKKDHIRMGGKVIIITGCNSGIGKETAIDLARRGAKIYMACRDKKRAEAAQNEIMNATSNRKVVFIPCDLASMESVRAFVRTFLAAESRLDVLINNAGVMFMPRTASVDGFEMHLAANHLGHFLLTNLLLDTLKTSMPSRIVNVSSNAYRLGRINRLDFNMEKSYSQYDAYFQSKLANILFTRALARKLLGTGVTANSLHPGVIRTELQRYKPLVGCMLLPFALFLKTPKLGAQTTIALAVDPELEQVSGRFFSDCVIAEETERARDDETAEWLWKISELMTGLKKNV